MQPTLQLVVFQIDESRFALDVAAVERVVRAVEVTPLPGAPAGVRGVVNIHGRIIPVFDLRARFDLPTREVQPDDHFVIAQSGRRIVGLIVDSVGEVVERRASELSNADDILPGLASVKGVMKLDGDIVLIEDMEQFLSIPDHDALDAALEIQG